METTRYAVVDASDSKVNDHADVHAAINEAKRNGNYAVVAEHYEYTQSTVEWTPNGDKNWPEESGDEADAE